MQELVTVPGDPQSVLPPWLVPEGQNRSRQLRDDRGGVNHNLVVARDVPGGELVLKRDPQRSRREGAVPVVAQTRTRTLVLVRVAAGCSPPSLRPGLSG